MVATRSLAPLLAVVCAACTPEAVGTDDVGDAEVCQSVEHWSTEAAVAEIALLDAVNEARQVGASCGADFLAPILPLELVPELRCASRLHARDLTKTGKLSHEGSDGSGTLERVGAAGYDGFPRHELLAADFKRAQDVVDAWLADEDHCRAVLDDDIVDAGPGADESDDGSRIRWVLTTGEPRAE